jgi:Tol biopolymer transport system component
LPGLPKLYRWDRDDSTANQILPLVFSGVTPSNPFAPQFIHAATNSHYACLTAIEPLSNLDNNQLPDVYRINLDTLQADPVTVNGGGSNVNGCSISSDGRFITFVSDLSYDAADTTSPSPNIYLRDMNAPLGVYTLVSTASSWEGTISGDGSTVAFTTSDRVVAADTDDAPDVYLWTRATNTYRRIPSGAGASAGATQLSLSADGGVVAFVATRSSDFTAQIYVHKVSDGMTLEQTIGADSSNGLPMLTANGDGLSFFTNASNLFADATPSTDILFTQRRR